MKGKLLVLEGNDGSGKTTQLKLLQAYLASIKITVRTIDFPRYTDSFYGKFLGRFLQGEFGELEDINPYLISIVYAEDREEARDQMQHWLSGGAIVLANRYVSSNLAHQSGRLPKEKREEFITWDLELEYEINALPKEDLVIYLHVPYMIADQLLTKKEKGKDMVERNTSYLRSSEESYLSLANRFSHWSTIECADTNGKLRTIHEIHNDIKKLLAEKGIVR